MIENEAGGRRGKCLVSKTRRTNVIFKHGIGQDEVTTDEQLLVSKRVMPCLVNVILSLGYQLQRTNQFSLEA